MLKNIKIIEFIDYKRILIYLFISLTIFGFIYIGSIEIFFNNWKEYGYNFIAFFKNILPEYVLYSLIFTAITYIISTFGAKVRKIIEVFFITILVFLLINLVFFPLNMLLDGRETVDVFSKTGIANIVLLLVILLATIFIYLKSEDKNKLLILAGFICSVYIVFNTVSAVTNSTYETKVSTTIQLSTLPDDILRLSKEKNIIYLVLDQFDASYFEEILAGNDGDFYKEIFKDFTYFNNYASAHPTTVFSGVASMAGKPYDNSMPYEAEFHKKVFSEGYSLFEKLKEKGWDNILYTNGFNNPYVYAPQLELYSNTIAGGGYDSAPSYKGSKYINASIYRTSPLFLRNIVNKIIYTSDKNGWAFDLYNIISKGKIVDNQNYTFMLLHSLGAHPPWVVDENLNISKDANVYSQAKASLKLVKLFLDNLKISDIAYYNNSVIIVTADHGFWRANTLLLIKGINENKEEMVIDNRPLSQVNIKNIILNLESGSKVSDIVENKERKYYHYIHLKEMDSGYFADIYEYNLPVILPKEMPDRIGFDRYKYEFVSIHSEPFGILSDGITEIKFPDDYQNLPTGVSLGGWKYEKDGLIAEDEYRAINLKLSETASKSITIEFEYSSVGGDNTLFIQGDNDYFAAHKLSGNKFKTVINGNKSLLLRFVVKNGGKIIIKNIKLNVSAL